MSEQQVASNEALVDLDPKYHEYCSPYKLIDSASFSILWKFSVL